MAVEATDRASAQQVPITAIDIVLEPDQAMLGRAHADNAALRAEYPDGFSLDATHHPHISIWAGFVPTADLPKVYDIAGEVLAKANFTAWELTAFKYYYIPLGPIGLAGIVIRMTPEILSLQRELVDAVGPMTVKTATSAAFYTTPEEPEIQQSVIDYIASFPKLVGVNFDPHVTIGVAPTAFLDAMLAAPFDAFTFSPVSASVYQFGDFGAARNRLKVFEPRS